MSKQARRKRKAKRQGERELANLTDEVRAARLVKALTDLDRQRKAAH